jgi:hypothetical protein
MRSAVLVDLSERMRSRWAAVVGPHHQVARVLELESKVEPARLPPLVGAFALPRLNPGLLACSDGNQAARPAQPCAVGSSSRW